MRNECNIIRDILPLYVEDMVSEDTASFVEEHLENCAECRKIAAEMKEPAEPADLYKHGMTSYVNEAAPLKLVKRKLRRKRLLTILLSFIVAAALVFGIVSVLFIWGVPAPAENFTLETEFQYSDTAYLNQIFCLHITQTENRSMSDTVKVVYLTDGDGSIVYDDHGNKIPAGYEVTVREFPIETNTNSNNFTIGYGYPGDEAPPEDFDFTITVKFKDKTVVYSMREEGLFVHQENVIRY